jgi:predicted metal-dependent hydrolase
MYNFYKSGDRAEKTMTKIFKLDTIPIKVEYKKVQTIRMTVYPPDGRVCISAPLDTTQESIRQFAASKLQWIKKHRERIRRNVKAKNQLKNDEIHFVWGKPYNLELIVKKGYSKIVLQDETMKFYVPLGAAKEKKQKILDKWYHHILQETAPPIVEKWESVIGVDIAGIYYRKMKSHWGSCNYQRQTIRLNTELAKKPIECLEYVIVHELIHIIEQAHNQAFYRLMNAYIPNWKIIRKKMNAGEI